MRHRRIGFVALILLLGGEAPLQAQIPWAENRWRIDAQDHAFERHAGRDALRLENGAAWLVGEELDNGTVEFDLFVTAGLGFHGLAFRAEDDANFEHFYVRPFQSGNPDATQYTPVFHGVSGWQIYSDARFAQAIDVPVDRWIHVEVRVRDRRAEVYVEGVPLAFPALQRRPLAGRLALTSSGAPARFANVLLDRTAPVFEVMELPEVADVAPSGLVTEWAVSEAFPEAQLDSLRALDPGWARGLSWDRLGTAVRGIADLAQLRSLSDGNTTFAAVTLRTTAPRAVRVRFGFSDRVHVYLNGRPVFRAADGWRSRDYRFLGTIGLHDELILPLEAGDNALWFAVSESFGGWGVTARVLDVESVEILPHS